MQPCLLIIKICVNSLILYWHIPTVHCSASSDPIFADIHFNKNVPIWLYGNCNFFYVRLLPVKASLVQTPKSFETAAGCRPLRFICQQIQSCHSNDTLLPQKLYKRLCIGVREGMLGQQLKTLPEEDRAMTYKEGGGRVREYSCWSSQNFQQRHIKNGEKNI